MGSSPTTRAKFYKMEGLKVWFKDMLDELLYKVQWPSLEDLQSSTVTVLIASIIIALIIFAMDFVFNQGMSGLYSLFVS